MPHAHTSAFPGSAFRRVAAGTNKGPYAGEAAVTYVSVAPRSADFQASGPSSKVVIWGFLAWLVAV